MGGVGGRVELIQLQCYEQRFESGASSPSLESCTSTPRYYPPSTSGDPQLLQMRPHCTICLSVFCTKLASRAKILLGSYFTPSQNPPACAQWSSQVMVHRAKDNVWVCCSTMCLSFQKSITCCSIFTMLWMIMHITT